MRYILFSLTIKRRCTNPHTPRPPRPTSRPTSTHARARVHTQQTATFYAAYRSHSHRFTVFQVAEHVSPGDDVYVSICPGSAATRAAASPVAAAAPAPAETSPTVATPAAVDAPRAMGEKLAKKLKVYVHYEAAAASKDPTATSVCIVEDTGKSVGDVITEFVHGYNSKHLDSEGFVPLEASGLCARTDAQLVVPAEASVAKTFKNGDDVWVVALEEAMKENNEVATVEANANAIQVRVCRVVCNGCGVGGGGGGGGATNISIFYIEKEAGTEPKVENERHEEIRKEPQSKFLENHTPPPPFSALQRSQQGKKEKSYYYWAQKPTHEQPAPREAPKQIRTREARQVCVCVCVCACACVVSVCVSVCMVRVCACLKVLRQISMRAR